MLEILVGLAPGVALSLFTLVLVYREQSGRTRADDRVVVLEKHLDDAVQDLDGAEQRARVYEQNTVSLQKQVDDLNSGKQGLTAQLALLQKANDDLLAVVRDQPGAVPAAVHASLDRLRALLAANTQTGDEGGDVDPGGGEAGAVHDDAAHPSSR